MIKIYVSFIIIARTLEEIIFLTMIIFYVKKRNVKIEIVHFPITKFNSFTIQADIKVSIVKNIIFQRKRRKNKIIKKILNHYVHTANFVPLLMMINSFPFNLLINCLEL